MRAPAVVASSCLFVAGAASAASLKNLNNGLAILDGISLDYMACPIMTTAVGDGLRVSLRGARRRGVEHGVVLVGVLAVSHSPGP